MLVSSNNNLNGDGKSNHVNLERIDLLQMYSTRRNTLALINYNGNNSNNNSTSSGNNNDSKKKLMKEGGNLASIAVGDRSGNLLLFNIDVNTLQKHLELQIRNSSSNNFDIDVNFITEVYRIPKMIATGGKEIGSLTLGGATKETRDRVFISYNNSIKAFSKKGKEFYNFTTNLTESIESMVVVNTSIFTAGEYSFQFYNDGKEQYFYTPPDKINHMICVNFEDSVNSVVPLLACRDRYIRALDIENEKLLYEISVEGSVTVLEELTGLLNNNENNNNSAQRKIIYGTEQGIFGLICCSKDKITKVWRVADANGNKNNYNNGNSNHLIGGITCCCIHDFFQTGRADIIIGRDDGNVEIWSFQNSNFAVSQSVIDEIQNNNAFNNNNVDFDSTPVMIFKSNVNESITSIKVGFVTNAISNDIIICTYSGKVMAFSSKSSIGHNLALTDSQYINSLKAEISELEMKLVNNYNSNNSKKLQVVTKGIKASETSLNVNAIVEKDNSPLNSNIAISQGANVKFMMDPNNPTCYIFTVEITSPIDFVLIQSELPLELLDVPSNVAILSKNNGKTIGKSNNSMPTSNLNSKGNESKNSLGKSVSDAQLLGTYRCTDKVTNRLEMKIGMTEGRCETLNAYIISNTSPKFCEFVTIQIKPLSFHKRVSSVNSNSNSNLSAVASTSNGVSSMTVTGNFTLFDIHSWLIQCLPDTPDKLHADETLNDGERKTHYYVEYQSAFLTESILRITYQKNKAIFQSNNVTVLSIIKDFITRDAVNKNIKINTNVLVNDDSVANLLSAIDVKFQYQLELKRKASLIDGMKEVIFDSNDAVEMESIFSQPLIELVKKGDEIKQELQFQSRMSEFLHGIITDMYVDFWKLKGKDSRNKVANLNNILQYNYTLPRLTAFYFDQI